MLADANPFTASGEFPLSLSALGSTYPNGMTADSNDWLDEPNGQYEWDAAQLHAAGYADHIYGHAVRDSSGKLWLQYWFFYYFNDFDVLGVGDHEGDWEMVEVGLDSTNKPDQVIFAQHTDAARCMAGQYQPALNGGPVVYAALGSHASYPMAGVYSVPGPARRSRSR